MTEIDLTKIKTLKQAKSVIAKLLNGINNLEKEEHQYSLDLWMAMEELFQDEKLFPATNIKSLKIFNPSINEHETIPFIVENIVCICAEPKKRKKHIYTYDTKISHYTINDNQLTFNKMCSFLDPLSTHLVVISKSAIVNVKFYDKKEKGLLKLKSELTLDNIIKHSPRKISPKLGLQNFIKVQSEYEYRVLLHQRVLRYKKSLEIE